VGKPGPRGMSGHEWAGVFEEERQVSRFAKGLPQVRVWQKAQRWYYHQEQT